MSVFKTFAAFADRFGSVLIVLTTAIIGGATALIGA